ncbi:hypothetical protein [Streptomyces sp. PR69]|uniref:hypothetical protein n=1 Tax=Streptomyces sp. PR69 TaxID=2984950 RepID=UPI002264B78E|nr:hypothetical protein [Streptomyces sp. PR69]
MTSRRRFLGMAGAAAATATLLEIMTGAVSADAAPATDGLFRPAAAKATARPSRSSAPAPPG